MTQKSKSRIVRFTARILLCGALAGGAVTFISACSTPAQRHDARVDARVDQRVDRRYDRRGWDN